MINTVELLIICIIVFIFGLSIGAISIASAENYDADVTEIIYNAGYEKGYERGKKEGATHDGTERATGGINPETNC